MDELTSNMGGMSTTDSLSSVTSIAGRIEDYAAKHTPDIIKSQGHQALLLLTNKTFIPTTGSVATTVSTAIEVGRETVRNLKSLLTAGFFGCIILAILEINFSVEDYRDAKTKEFAAEYRPDFVSRFHTSIVPEKPDFQGITQLTRADLLVEKHKLQLELSTRALEITRAGTEELAVMREAYPKKKYDQKAYLRDAIADDPEYQQLNKAVNEWEQFVNDESAKEYSRQMEDYRIAQTLYANVKMESEEYSRSLTSKQRIFQVLDILVNCFASILSKMTDGLGKHPYLLGIVQAQVTMPSPNGSMETVTVINPVAQNHLAGIYHNLLHHYFTPNMHAFIQTLISTVTFKWPDGVSRMEGMRKFNDIVSTWERLGFWRFMTPDVFFTAFALHSMPDRFASTKERLLLDLTDSMKASATRRAGDFSLRVDEASSMTGGPCSSESSFHMPIYRRFNDGMQIYEDMAVGASMDNPAANDRSAHQQSYSRYGNKKSWQAGQLRGEGDQAHAAGEAIDSISPLNPVSATSQFQFEVFPDANWGCIDYAQKACRYSATLHPCSKCYSQDPSNVHHPRCYSKPCGKCSLYGHCIYQCAQHKLHGFKAALLAKGPSAKAGGGPSQA